MQSLISSRRPVKASRPRSARISPAVNGCHALELTPGGNVTHYWLEPLASDFGRAFRLIKWDTTPGTDKGTRAYECVLDPEGFSSCSCKGWCGRQRWKHLDGLAALIRAGKL
jgi:hypothetical protein